MSETLQQILSFKKHLERYLEKSAEEIKILHVLKKLKKLPITLDHLQETEIGKVVNSYRKYPGEVGPRAKALIQQWKALVRDEEVDEGKGAPGGEGSLVKEEPGNEEENIEQDGEENEKAPPGDDFEIKKEKPTERDRDRHSSQHKSSHRSHDRSHDKHHRSHDKHRSSHDEHRSSDAKSSSSSHHIKVHDKHHHNSPSTIAKAAEKEFKLEKQDKPPENSSSQHNGEKSSSKSNHDKLESYRGLSNSPSSQNGDEVKSLEKHHEHSETKQSTDNSSSEKYNRNVESKHSGDKYGHNGEKKSSSHRSGSKEPSSSHRSGSKESSLSHRSGSKEPSSSHRSGSKEPLSSHRSGFKEPSLSHISGSKEPSLANMSGSKESHRSGSKEPHRSGSKEPHRSGSKESHRSGSKEPHRSGSKEPHRSGSKEPHRSGSKEPSSSSKDRREHGEQRGANVKTGNGGAGLKSEKRIINTSSKSEDGGKEQELSLLNGLSNTGEDMDEEYDPANAKMSNEKYDSLSAKIDRFRSAMVPDLDVFSAKKKGSSAGNSSSDGKEDKQREHSNSDKHTREHSHSDKQQSKIESKHDRHHSRDKDSNKDPTKTDKTDRMKPDHDKPSSDKTHDRSKIDKLNQIKHDTTGKNKHNISEKIKSHEKPSTEKPMGADKRKPDISIKERPVLPPLPDINLENEAESQESEMEVEENNGMSFEDMMMGLDPNAVAIKKVLKKLKTEGGSSSKSKVSKVDSSGASSKSSHPSSSKSKTEDSKSSSSKSSSEHKKHVSSSNKHRGDSSSKHSGSSKHSSGKSSEASHSSASRSGSGDKNAVSATTSSSHSKSSSSKSHHSSSSKSKSSSTKSSSSQPSSSSGKPSEETTKSSKGSRKRKSSVSLEVPVPNKELKLSTNEIVGSLPEISPNYKALPHLPVGFTSPHKKGNDIDDSLVASKKGGRMAVYSGRRNCFLTSVPRLYDACIRTVMDNEIALYYLGALFVPYKILEPVLKRCTATQLYEIEESNPHYIEDTNGLWEKHCNREFKGQKPVEDDCEKWRELYLRKLDERQDKLKKLTLTLNKSKAEAVPMKQTRLAYVDCTAKAPREVRRRQIMHGTAGPSKVDPHAKLTSHRVPGEHVPKPPPAMPIPQPIPNSPRRRGKKTAPLMKKLIKRFK